MSVYRLKQKKTGNEATKLNYSGFLTVKNLLFMLSSRPLFHDETEQRTTV